MATFRMEVEGMNELFSALKKAEDKSLGIAAQSLYEGAGIIADAVSKSVQGIRTAPFKYATGGDKRLPSPEEKEALEEAPHGVGKFRKRLKKVETTVGFNGNGYVDVNFRHMNANARTNYKAVFFKRRGTTASSTLKFLNMTTGGNLGRGAQNRKPVGAIANAINSGTSFMQKQPFIRKAFKQSEAAAVAVIEEGIRKRIEELNIG